MFYVVIFLLITCCICLIARIAYKIGKTETEKFYAQQNEALQQESLEIASRPALSADDIIKLMQSDGKG